MPTTPAISFHTLIQTFGLQALMFCGRIPNPMTGKTEPDLDMAQVQIAFLEVLDEKTRGNLSEDEQKMLQNYLHESRMAYVEAARAGTETKPETVELSPTPAPPTSEASSSEGATNTS